MRTTNIKIASGISILGAILAFITLSIIISKDTVNIAAALYVLVIALLFFGMAGQFYENGIVKGQAVALILAAFTLVAIIAAYILQSAFATEWLVALLICAVIPAILAAAETDWYKAEKI